jgi:hypothetical protein
MRELPSLVPTTQVFIGFHRLIVLPVGTKELV